MDKQAEALKIVNYHVGASAVVGCVPAPVIDMIGITAVQLNMLRKISEIYEVPFTRNIVKTLLSALVGGVAPTKAAAGAAGLALKFVPGAGTVVALATVPAYYDYYAVGRIFVEHFESQGTFLTFRQIAA